MEEETEFFQPRTTSLKAFVSIKVLVKIISSLISNQRDLFWGEF